MSSGTIEHEDIVVRPAEEVDLDAIIAIENQSYPFPWTRQAFQNEMIKPFSNVFVLDEGTGVIGYVVYWLLFDECHVLNVAIDPKRRGQGLSKRLMGKVIGAATSQGMKRVFLEVRKSNAAAISLYKKLGFDIDHVKPSFYEDGEDAYFMVRYLPSAVA